jgi:hypothetical protein
MSAGSAPRRKQRKLAAYVESQCVAIEPGRSGVVDPDPNPFQPPGQYEVSRQACTVASRSRGRTGRFSSNSRTFQPVATTAGNSGEFRVRGCVSTGNRQPPLAMRQAVAVVAGILVLTDRSSEG